MQHSMRQFLRQRRLNSGWYQLPSPTPNRQLRNNRLRHLPLPGLILPTDKRKS